MNHRLPVWYRKIATCNIWLFASFDLAEEVQGEGYDSLYGVLQLYCMNVWTNRVTLWKTFCRRKYVAIKTLFWTRHNGEQSKICHIHSNHSEKMPCQSSQQLPLSSSHVVLMSKHAGQVPLPLYCRQRPLLSHSIQVAHYFSFWKMLASTSTLVCPSLVQDYKSTRLWQNTIWLPSEPVNKYWIISSQKINCLSPYCKLLLLSFN